MLIVAAVLWVIDLTCVTTCPCCKRRRLRRDVRRRRRNTSYCKSLDDNNYLTSCGDCYDEDCEYWADMWADYYSGCM